MLRFEQEAYAASALNHPNILTIYEIGQANDGYVKVLDFGLAKLSESQRFVSDPEAETVRMIKTDPEVVMGTVSYMSPGQVRGLEVDELTDIWGLGVVIYEMLAGNTPFVGSTSSDVIASILKTEPLPLERFSPSVPTELLRILKKTLRKNKMERYQTAKDLVLDLKNLRREIESGAPGRPFTQKEVSSVAILPFRNLTNDSTVSFYEFSLADAVITELVRLRSLVVRPSSAITKYLGQAKDPREAGRELNVKAILAASFLHAAPRVRVTAQLLDVQSGDVIWGDRIDSDASDIIAVQDSPDHPLLRAFRAEVFLLRGDAVLALELLQEVLHQHPEMDGVRPLYAQCLSAVGEHAAARAQLTERVKEAALADHDIPYWVASVYAMEGEHDEAFEWLGKAIGSGNENLPWFKSNPAWQSLHDNPRFIELMHRVEVDLQNASVSTRRVMSDS